MVASSILFWLVAQTGCDKTSVAALGRSVHQEKISQSLTSREAYGDRGWPELGFQKYHVKILLRDLKVSNDARFPPQFWTGLKALVRESSPQDILWAINHREGHYILGLQGKQLIQITFALGTLLYASSRGWIEFQPNQLTGALIPLQNALRAQDFNNVQAVINVFTVATVLIKRHFNIISIHQQFQSSEAFELDILATDPDGKHVAIEVKNKIRYNSDKKDQFERYERMLLEGKDASTLPGKLFKNIKIKDVYFIGTKPTHPDLVEDFRTRYPHFKYETLDYINNYDPLAPKQAQHQNQSVAQRAN